MTHKYWSSRTRTPHSYNFFYQRRHDPRWRADFLRVRALRRRRLGLRLGGIVIVLILGGTGIWAYQKVAPKPTPARTVKSSTPAPAEKPKSKKTPAPAPDPTPQEKPAQEDSATTSAPKESRDRPSTQSTAVIESLVGMGFRITPTLYDNLSVNQAMDENKAPQNLVHDGVTVGYFQDQTTVLTRLPMANSVDQSPYQVTEQTIQVDQIHQVPYRFENGQVHFQTWTTKDEKGHVITWQCEPYSGAKTVLDNLPKKSAQ
ncbi:hypothetical protein HU830_02705 [Lactobacillus sp. DCY120]|uniref:Uncharacterized protein n=1 Tax=Bombilactobacillus apium TaxID=2675299 RepID=A0A850QWC1_9LACO|nr:hypothetical protein [Bombilactobacillus apium]NVY96094.1 hypothetical protein [Bombilactobacillus apium]